MIMGTDGGVHVSYDGGKTCEHFANIPGGEFYAIAVDMEDPYRIYGGMQDHDSWRGPDQRLVGAGSGTEDWVTVGDNDGMYNQVDPTDSRWVYNSVQWGGHYRADMKTLTRKADRADAAGRARPPLRFNWTPPIRISPHNSQIVYTGAQVLFRSLDRGDHWEEISPDLTTNDASKISPPGSTVQVLHHHDDLRVAAQGGDHLGRRRRREGAGDAGTTARRWTRRDRGASGQPAGRPITSSRGWWRRPSRDGNGLRDAVGPAVRQAGAVGVQDGRFRRHLDAHHGGPAARSR